MERTTKYNVGKSTASRTYNGIVFDSAVEMRYYKEIVIPGLESGDIVSMEMQKRYILQEAFIHNGKKIQPIEYRADFYIVDKSGKETVIDIKGCPNPEAKLKRKLFWYVYPNLDYVWLGYSVIDGGWVTYETIKAGRAQRKKEKKLKEKQENNEKK